MRRREFSALTGSGIAAAVLPATRARAAVADPALLKTELTPLGAERAGNADGSIPGWIGGLTTPALPATQPIDVPLFIDEAPLLTVDAGNMAQSEKLLTPGTRAMMRKFGFSVKIYQTHRTAAAPQYVYDNTSQNVTRARLDTAGGQMGITGAYGGVPFPIIDPADRSAAGAQLIWNHLTSWCGFALRQNCITTVAVMGGKVALSSAARSLSLYPYYDPNATLSTYEDMSGWFFSKIHKYNQGPPNVRFEEWLSWQSTNLALNKSINWLAAPDPCPPHKTSGEVAYATLSPIASQIAALDEYSCFYGSPTQYDWQVIGKQEMLVPYNCNAMQFCDGRHLVGQQFPNPDIVRWEKHRVWIVEASLRAAQSNALARRRLYIDEDSWLALLGEGYNASGRIIKCHSTYNHCIPSLPATCKHGSLVFDLVKGNYVYEGNIRFGTNTGDEFAGKHAIPTFNISDPDAAFYPESMADCSMDPI